MPVIRRIRWTKSPYSLISAADRPRLPPGRLVHERHERVGEAGHGAADADPADVGASPDAAHPAALGHVAVDHRPPAAELDLALVRVEVPGEIALLVEGGPVAAVVHARVEHPVRAQHAVERRRGRGARGVVEQPGQGLHEVLRPDGAAGDVHDREARGGLVVPAEVVAQPHAAVGLPAMAWMPP